MRAVKAFVNMLEQIKSETRYEDMSSEAHDEAYIENNEITLEDVYWLIRDSHRKMIQSFVIDALRDAGYEPYGLSWNIIVEFFDDKESKL